MFYDAEHFAKLQHANQKYGDEPYDVHLDAVVAVVKEFSSEGHIIDGAWLHDVIEDTDCTYFELTRRFGTPTANIVWGCTGVGKNRKARQASILAKVDVFPGAPLVKTADRIANVENNLATKNYSKWSMYMREQEDFIRHVEDYVPVAMIARLRKAREDGLVLFVYDIKLDGRGI